MKLNHLNSQEKKVIIHKGTEPPFTGKYNNFFQPGTYICKHCNTPLFKSTDKFSSHCGWPSFDQAIPGAVKQIPDPDGRRSEIICQKCGAHLGHVFTGKNYTPKNTRHCVNSMSLKFIPKNEAKSKNKTQ